MTPEDPAAEHPHTPLGESAPVGPVDVPARTLVLVGTGIWAVALVVTLLVPALHTGDRSWWPWTCATGMALGAFAWWYVGRMPGSAERA